MATMSLNWSTQPTESASSDRVVSASVRTCARGCADTSTNGSAASAAIACSCGWPQAVAGTLVRSVRPDASTTANQGTV